jgi:hypothetical protein
MPDHRGRASLALLSFALLALAFAPAQAQTQAQGPRIYSCIDSNGKRLTSDRTIPECAAREQKILNSDGSVNRVVPPTLTADERADLEQREREASAERVARQDAVRRDRNLMARFPNEGAHRKAREKALDDVRNSVRISETRVKLLTAERKPLLDESEFYLGKPLPPKLKAALDANDASLAAQRTLIQNQEVEVSRINGLFDSELVRLRQLWAGAPAGSLGLYQAPQAANTPAQPTPK